MKINVLYRKLYLLLICTLFLMTSCLEMGLDDLEAYDDAEILSFKFEHRWEQQIDESGVTRLSIVSLPTDVRIENEVIYCTIKVPEVGNPSSFTEDVREDVKLEKIVGMATISTAAKIIPLDDAPVLGKWGDFSQTCKYRVVAADNVTFKDWTIHCELVK